MKRDTFDTPYEIDSSIVEEIFRLKVDKEKFKDKLKEIESIARRIGKPKEDPLNVFLEIRNKAAVQGF